MRETVLGRIELNVFGVAIVIGRVRRDLAGEITVGNVAFGLVVKSLADLVDEN